jgi:hypothetical protein
MLGDLYTDREEGGQMILMSGAAVVNAAVGGASRG